MRARRPIAVALLLAASLMANAGIAAASPSPDGGTLVTPSQATRALHRAEAALHGSGAQGQDVTTLLLRLQRAIPSLGSAQRQAANDLLARPTDKVDPQGTSYRTAEHSPPLCSAHFCVHWVDSSVDAPPKTDANGNGIPDFVEQASQIAEYSYSIENDKLGWAPAKSDGTLGGDSRTDIYLANVGNQGVFGYTAPDPGQSQKHGVYTYLVMDNDFSAQEFPGTTPLGDLQVTFAHEYNHVLQFSYTALQDLWFIEDSATWMEDQVYPEINDYFRYLKSFANATRTPLTFGSSRVYGDVVFNHWIASRYGPQVIRDAWAGAPQAKPYSFSVNAYNRSLRLNGGQDVSHEFGQLAAASAEWHSPGVFNYPDLPAWPEIKRIGKLVPGRTFKTTLDHTSYQQVRVARTSGGRLILRAGTRRGVPEAIALVGRIGDEPTGTVESAYKYAAHGGLQNVVLNDPGRFSRITAVLVNTETRQKGFGLRDWLYRHDNEPFRAKLLQR